MHIFFQFGCWRMTISLGMYHSSSTWNDNLLWFWHLLKHKVHEHCATISATRWPLSMLVQCQALCYSRLHLSLWNKRNYQWNSTILGNHILFHANVVLLTKVISNFQLELSFNPPCILRASSLFDLAYSLFSSFKISMSIVHEAMYRYCLKELKLTKMPAVTFSNNMQFNIWMNQN